MRFLISTCAALLVLSPISGLEAQANVRIAYIDSQVILQEAPGAREAQQEFDQEMQRFRQEIEQMGEELDGLIQEFQRQQQTLTAEAREARADEIRQKEMEYQRRVDEMEEEAARKREELVAPILDRMSDAIEAIRQEGDYTMIFDAAARSIIAADPALDLTSEVIQRLRQADGSEDR